MSAVSIRPKGGDFVRAAIFLMRAQGRPAQAAADAEAAFGPTSPAALITRSVVASGTTFDANFAAPLAPYRVCQCRLHRSTAADDGPWPDVRFSSCAFALQDPEVYRRSAWAGLAKAV